MVDKTHYTDGSELTYKEKNHLIAFCTDLENYNVYNRTPQHYGQYAPLVRVLNYGNYHGDTLVRFLLLRHWCIFCILLKLNYIANYEVFTMFFNKKSRWIVCLI